MVIFYLTSFLLRKENIKKKVPSNGYTLKKFNPKEIILPLKIILHTHNAGDFD